MTYMQIIARHHASACSLELCAAIQPHVRSMPHWMAFSCSALQHIEVPHCNCEAQKGGMQLEN